MNKQFKVGDKVRRIHWSNEPFARVGQVAFVNALDKDGHLFVLYEGHNNFDKRGELWLKDNTELVQVQESPCKFVPGSTYKGRTGKEYRFVIYAEEAAPHYRAVFLTSTGKIACRYSDGRFEPTMASDMDILPNKKTRNIAVYTDGVRYLAGPPESFDEAPTTLRQIGEVVEEYETY